MSNTRVVVARTTGGGYCAVAAKCPHMGGSMVNGRLEGNIIACPRHGSRFDVRTGEVVEWVPGGGSFRPLLRLSRKSRPIKTYRVSARDEELYIQL
jgi:nitrite reductase/ring-hydroxylating ferredoxin subunit